MEDYVVKWSSTMMMINLSTLIEGSGRPYGTGDGTFHTTRMSTYILLRCF